MKNRACCFTGHRQIPPGEQETDAQVKAPLEEHIFVLRGTLRLVLGDKTVDVGEKQAVRFRADIPHAYQNLSGSECAVYNTIFYPSR